MTATLHLRRGRERSLERRHPWIFSGAVERLEGLAQGAGPGMGPGETIAVRAADGRFLAWAAHSPRSQIVARVWSFDEAEPMGEELLRRRLASALALRRPLLARPDLTACRLVNAESDGLPGLVVDRYGEFLVCQLTAAGAERWRDEIAAALPELAAAEGITVAGVFERSDAEVRGKEGLAPRVGAMAGGEPPAQVEIVEDGRRYLVDLRGGHKTGFYLDQRDNRSSVAAALAAHMAAVGATGGEGAGEPPRVLNAFSYTGGFTVAVAAAAPGAVRVTEIDSSADALELARANHLANGIDPAAVEQVTGNCFGELRRLRAEERRFDLVVLDPPRFVDSKGQLPRASRGYKDINLLALQLLAPGGLLATFSCSGLMPPELFQKIVADAAVDAGRRLRLLHRLGPGADHPVDLAFPEGSYLKGLLCAVD